MKTIGYLRVSTGGQTTENQRLAVYEAGYTPDEWLEVIVSGKSSREKRKIDLLVSKLKKGDMVVVSELSRLGRSIGHIIMLVDEMKARGIALHCIKEGIKIGPSGSNGMQSKVMVTLFSLFAEIERDLISERTKEGIARARANGSVPGRPKGSNNHQLDSKIEEVKELVGKGLSKTAIAAYFEVSWSSVNHFIKTRKIAMKKG